MTVAGALMFALAPSPAGASISASGAAWPNGADTPQAGTVTFSLAASDVASRILLRWSDGVRPDRRAEVLAAALDDGVLADLDAERVTDDVDVVRAFGPALDAAHALEGFAEVAVAEPDRIVTMPASANPRAPRPNDAIFEQQWGLENTGQSILRDTTSLITGEAGVDIRARQAWSVTQGNADVVVAVIDTAVDETHPDLDGAIVGQESTVYAASGDISHGTSVASVIAARSDDGFGIAGTAPQTSIYSIAAFTTTDHGPTSSMASVLMAFDLAKQASVDVINASWVTAEDSQVLREAVASAGVPVVAAAGNAPRVLEPGAALYPAGWDLPNVVSVTAIDPDGRISPFANTGPAVVDVAAPGSSIMAAFPRALDEEPHPHGFVDGTSFSAPFVSGALALASAAAPYATTSELVDAVSWTSRFRSELTSATIASGLLDASALVRGVERPICRPDLHGDSGFGDVSSHNVHARSIDCIAALGMTSGRAPGEYDPSSEVTRGQMASFLHGVVDRELDVESSDGTTFDDVPTSSVHHESVEALAALGIVRGDGEGRFRPHESLTRAHLASFVVRTHEVLVGAERLPTRRWFDDTEHSTHVDEIDHARDLGLVRGVGTRAFDPASLTRRDQMASLLARTLDALAREGVGVA